MKIGDLLLLKGYINKKQLKTALRKQSEEAIKYDRSVPLGKILIELKYVSVDEVADALNEQPEEKKEVKEKKVMPTEIGENSKFTFDLKFIVTIGAVLVSASATYFSITGKLNEIESNNHPNRMEYNLVVKELDNLKGAGDLKIITYKLEQYDDMFEEIKGLVKEIDIPEIDLSGIELKLDNLSSKIGMFETRIKKLEKSSGGRF